MHYVANLCWIYTWNKIQLKKDIISTQRCTPNIKQNEYKSRLIKIVINLWNTNFVQNILKLSKVKTVNIMCFKQKIYIILVNNDGRSQWSHVFKALRENHWWSKNLYIDELHIKIDDKIKTYLGIKKQRKLIIYFKK